MVYFKLGRVLMPAKKSRELDAPQTKRLGCAQDHHVHQEGEPELAQEKEVGDQSPHLTKAKAKLRLSSFVSWEERT